MIFLGAFALSMLAVLALTPAVRTLAERLSFLDHPNGSKVHRRPTPLMGGIAVSLASLAAAAAALALIRCPYSARIVGFMSGGLMVVVALSFLMGWRAIVLNLFFIVMVMLMLFYYRRKIGCITGDMLGAMTEVTETALFLLMAMAVLR